MSTAGDDFFGSCDGHNTCCNGRCYEKEELELRKKELLMMALATGVVCEHTDDGNRNELLLDLVKDGMLRKVHSRPHNVGRLSYVITVSGKEYLSCLQSRE